MADDTSDTGPNDDAEAADQAPPTAEPKAKGVDATGATPAEADAKDELFEAIDHLKNAASILFGKAKNDPALRNVTRETGRVVKQVGEGVEPLVKNVADAAEPIAREVAKEVGRLTKDVLGAVDRAQHRMRRDEEE